MKKAGRYTAALLLIAVGGSLLLDQSMDTNYVGQLLGWWPLLLISLGVEYIVSGLINPGGSRPMKFDFGGIIIALLISIIVIGTTQSSSLSFSSLKLHINPFSFTDEAGTPFERGITLIPLDADTNKVVIENPNGSVTLKSGDVKQIEVDVTLYVSKLNDEDAKKIAESSRINYNEGSTLKIIAQSESYRTFGVRRKPRMNLTITLPQGHEVDMELQLSNGKVVASDIPIRDELKIHTTNGSVDVTNIGGKIIAESTNGSMQVNEIDGDVELDTVNGSAVASSITGDVSMDTTNGSITASHVDGSVEADSTNGRIVVEETTGDLAADTTNGGITVISSIVGGDWKLDTTLGRIEITVPENGHFEVKGSAGMGSVTSELPLTISKKTIKGTIGFGEHRIEMDTNGGITVRKFQK